jgi:exonuclease-1
MRTIKTRIIYFHLMGVNELLKNLVLKRTKVSEIEFKSVGIDMSCFIHKAKYAGNCELAEHNSSEAFSQRLWELVGLFLERCEVLYLVFDGDVPDEKKSTHLERRSDFEKKKKLAQEYLKMNSPEFRAKGRTMLTQTIEVRELESITINTLSKINDKIKFIRSDYESDWKLARMFRDGVIDLVVTEDSDLIAYDCKRIIFKLDISSGECDLYLFDESFIIRDTRKFSGKVFVKDFKLFKEFCVLSGTDYFKGVRGIGVVTAMKHAFLGDLTSIYERMTSQELDLYKHNLKLFNELGYEKNNIL